MYKLPKYWKTTLKSVVTTEGETLEQKIERIIENKEPIKDGAPEIFTERKEGVLAAYNIKTDRFEIACEAMDKVSMSIAAKREEKATSSNENKETKVIKIGEAEPTQGTSETANK